MVSNGPFCSMFYINNLLCCCYALSKIETVENIKINMLSWLPLQSVYLMCVAIPLPNVSKELLATKREDLSLCQNYTQTIEICASLENASYFFEKVPKSLNPLNIFAEKQFVHKIYMQNIALFLFFFWLFLSMLETAYFYLKYMGRLINVLWNQQWQCRLPICISASVEAKLWKRLSVYNLSKREHILFWCF